MLRDIRDVLAADLRDPEFQRELIAVAYEEDGVEGLLRALNDIAHANSSPTKAAERTEVDGTNAVPPPRTRRNPTFRKVREALNALDLDLTIVRKQ